MNVLERCKAFAQSLRGGARRTAWDRKQCPACGNTLTIKNGSNTRHPWFLGRRETVRVQRHLCHACSKSYSKQSAPSVQGRSNPLGGTNPGIGESASAGSALVCASASPHQLRLPVTTPRCRAMLGDVANPNQHRKKTTRMHRFTQHDPHLNLRWPG